MTISMQAKPLFSLLAIACFLLSALPSTAQRAEIHPRQIRLNTFFDKDTASGLSFGRIAPAYVVRNANRFWHTIELNQLKLKNKNSNAGLVRIYGLGIRHQFDVPVGPRWKNFQLTAGTSERLGVNYSTFEPSVETIFGTSFFEFRTDLGLIPALHVYPLDRLDVSIGTLFRLFEASYATWTNSDPSLPLSLQRQVVFGYDAYFFQFRSVVVGLGYLF
ncbi:MAG: hypothetical protein AAF587_43160 [Bacteroidota bacterium]